MGIEYEYPAFPTPAPAAHSSDNVTFEDRSVTILDGMCESADRCGIATCKFYDVSPAGNARYIAALRKSHTLEGLLEEKRRH